jgi:hypothetical protein
MRRFIKIKRSRTDIIPAMITARPPRCRIRGMIAAAAESSCLRAIFINWELALRRDDVVSAAVKSKMFAPQFKIREGTAYGYGWFVMETGRGTKMLYHGGNETPAGFTAEFRRYPDENVTTILMVNSMIDEIGLNRVVSGNIASIVFGGKADFVRAAARQNRRRRFADLRRNLSNRVGRELQSPGGKRANDNRRGKSGSRQRSRAG